MYISSRPAKMMVPTQQASPQRRVDASPDHQRFLRSGPCTLEKLSLLSRKTSPCLLPGCRCGVLVPTETTSEVWGVRTVSGTVGDPHHHVLWQIFRVQSGLPAGDHQHKHAAWWRHQWNLGEFMLFVIRRINAETNHWKHKYLRNISAHLYQIFASRSNEDETGDITIFYGLLFNSH